MVGVSQRGSCEVGYPAGPPAHAIWRILFRSDPARGCATADAIVAGEYDAQLRKQAAEVKALGAPILVRFNYEMTGNAKHTCFTGFAVKQNPSLAGSKFIAAWKHVVDSFRAVGATNVKWVWAPGKHAFEKGLWSSFYPGGDYVDWIGIDDYNGSTTRPRSPRIPPSWRSMRRRRRSASLL